MAKKTYIIIFLIIIIIILFIGAFEYIGVPHSDSTLKVGVTTFNMPDGYHEGTPNEFGAINITNGTNSIFILENNDSNIMNYINEYKYFINNSRNQTMNIINFTIDNTLIYKTDNQDDPNIIHYWFVKNKKTYDIYTWDGNEKMDSVVINMIPS